MEVKYFRLIKTIAEEGNIANSSEKLFLTQSALSHQLKELEERLGFKVFLRTRQQWKLTPEGEALYDLSNKVLATIEQGFHKIQHLREGSRGVIRFGAECYSFYQGVSAFLQKLSFVYPEIKVNLNLETNHKSLSKLLNNEVDIALASNPTHCDQLLSIEVFQDEIFAYLHQENPLSEKDFLEARDFEKQHLIIHSFPLNTVAVYEDFLKDSNVMPDKISAIPMTEVSLELVSSNQGITCLPQWALKSFKVSRDLRSKKIGREGLKRRHYLLIRKEDAQKRYISDFIGYFQESFSFEEFC